MLVLIAARVPQPVNVYGAALVHTALRECCNCSMQLLEWNWRIDDESGNAAESIHGMHSGESEAKNLKPKERTRVPHTLRTFFRCLLTHFVNVFFWMASRSSVRKIWILIISTHKKRRQTNGVSVNALKITQRLNNQQLLIRLFNIVIIIKWVVSSI